MFISSNYAKVSWCSFDLEEFRKAVEIKKNGIGMKKK